MSALPGTIRVVHVDADTAFADTVAAFLEDEDDRFAVRTAGTVESALETLGDRDVDCIVSGYDLPHHDGIRFLKAVREDYPDLPFILFSEDESEDVAAKAIRQGVTSFLPKDRGSTRYAVLRNRIEAHVERYRTKQEVARLKEEHQLLGRTATDAFWVLYPDTEEFRIGGMDQFGYEDYELTLDWWLDRVHPDDRERVSEHDEAVLADEPAAFEKREPGRGWFTNEYRWQRADGTYAECVERGVVIFEDGDPVKMVGTTTDVTERRERERDLERTGDLLEQTERIADVAGWEIDPETMEVFWTDHLFDLVGIGAGEPPPLEEALDVYHEDDRPVVEDAVEEALEAGEPFDVEARIRRPDGEIRWLRVLGNPRTADGDVVTLRGAVQDVTTRKAYERQLEQQNERLEEFAGVVSHDLRSPLNVIGGNLELAGEECDSEYLDDAADAVDRCLTLIDDLLTLAREGERVDEVEPVDLADAAASCRSTVATPDMTLVTECERRILADPGRLRQLLENLVRNAVDHGSEDVTVTVGELADGFYVADDGPGIPPEKRERVFEAKYSTSRSGTGLGLSIVRGIAEAHGWTIRATDGAEGGARFDITGVEFVD